MCHFSPLLFLQNSQGGIAWILVKQEAIPPVSPLWKAMRKEVLFPVRILEPAKSTFEVLCWWTVKLCSSCALVLLFWEEYVTHFPWRKYSKSVYLSQQRICFWDSCNYISGNCTAVLLKWHISISYFGSLKSTDNIMNIYICIYIYIYIYTHTRLYMFHQPLFHYHSKTLQQLHDSEEIVRWQM